MISYAQNQEDVFLNRLFKQKTGFYIDVGACHPTVDSVTRHFYNRGWSGINIEPIPAMLEKLKDERPRDINLHLALSNQSGESDFFTCPDALVLSTLTLQIAQDIAEAGVQMETIRIQTQTLEEVCAAHCTNIETIHFMKIDVEGHEKGVLEGGNFRQWRPQVILVEATQPRSRIQNYHEWENILLSADYSFACFDGLNRYYVRHENKELIEPLSQPLSSFDKYLRYPQIAQFNWVRFQIQHALGENDSTKMQQVIQFLAELEKRPEWLIESPGFLSMRFEEFIQSEPS